MNSKSNPSFWMRAKNRWRLMGPWSRTFILLDVVCILALFLMIGAMLLHPLIIVVWAGGLVTDLVLVNRFPFLAIFVLSIGGSAFSAVVTPLDQFPEKRFRVVALFLCSWIGTITYLVCLYFQNLWILNMSSIIGDIWLEPYPGYWVQMGLQNIIFSHISLIPGLMLLGLFGMVIAYLFQYWILGL